MEPFRKSINDSEVNSKCDDQEFDRVIKRELIEDTDNNDDNQSSQFGVKSEFEGDIIKNHTKIKIEKDLNDGYVLEGTVKTEFNSSELIIQLNSDTTSKSINSNALFTRRPNIHTSGRKNLFFCDKCKKSYFTKSFLIKHILRCTGKLYKTDVHDEGVSQAKDLMKHKRTRYTGLKPYVCNICDKNFHKPSLLTVHSRKHSGVKPFECDICQKRFTGKGYLKTHKMTHTRVKPFQCDICNKAFLRKGDLKRHIMTHTGDKPYKCDSCDKLFSQAGHLKDHKNTHTGEKPYKCDTCYKVFSQAPNLKRHKMTHTRIKPFQCDICNKAFSQKADLKKHIRTHTGDKPYACNNCDKRFTQVGSLKIHKNTHTGYKPYECDSCDKRFYQPEVLKRHKRTHSGDKPFKSCDICDKRFTQAGNLKIHINTHTGVKPYECDLCLIELEQLLRPVSTITKTELQNTKLMGYNDDEISDDFEGLKKAGEISKEDYSRLIEFIEPCRPIWDHKINLSDRSENVKDRFWNQVFVQFEEKKLKPSGCEGKKKEWIHLKHLTFLESMIENIKHTSCNLANDETILSTDSDIREKNPKRKQSETLNVTRELLKKLK
ncbi:zinc finger protein 260-like [Metopolophium dirhodum]|uniref:zinc finger protein 260-like n=1 Tax=Metopolophium dirhodum TaxID=44670 RepID=UPI00298FF749|nr:zinc finger protein 260-like [Metopolophium dirhodum]